MYGLIIVTWEQFLADSFGSPLLSDYRHAMGETAASAPLASRVYDDALLVAGVDAACRLTRLPAETLLEEYGRYFILSGLTSHLCAYLLNQVHSGQELLLTMRQTHQQMRRTLGYEDLPGDPHGFVLVYESSRLLCPMLWWSYHAPSRRIDTDVRAAEAAAAFPV